MDFFKSEPYISYPLLSAIRSSPANVLLSKLLHFNHGNDWFQPPSYGYDAQSRSSYYFGNGGHPASASDLTTADGTIRANVRLASLGLVAKNIFKDIVIRPIHGFARFVKTAAGVLDHN